MAQQDPENRQAAVPAGTGGGGEGKLFVDFGKSAGDYARHRKSFPASTIERICAFGVGVPGQRMVDLGTGTGQFGLEFARLGCDVTGIDPSERLLEKARGAAGRESLEAHFITATAEETTLSAGGFDAVLCATAWHWFDKPKAAAEAFRLLKPGGKLIIAVLGWHFLPGNLPSRTMDLIREYVPARGGITLSTLRYPDWTDDLVTAGFTGWEVFTYIEPIPYSHEDWCGRVRASQGIGPVLSPEEVARFSDALRAMLAEAFPEDPYPVEHRVEVLVAW